jgi:anti-sigma factor RsiW
MGLTWFAAKENKPISRPANQRKKRSRARERMMPMTCRGEVEFLDRYLSSDLSERQRAHFESHLAVCRDCLAFLQTYKATIELTRSFLSSQSQSSPSNKLSLKRPTGRAQRG